MLFPIPGFLDFHDALDTSSSSTDSALVFQLCILMSGHNTKHVEDSPSLKDIYSELFPFQRRSLEYKFLLIVVIPTGDVLGGGRWN